MELSIRNTSIIAHIDHGSPRSPIACWSDRGRRGWDMRAQYLDSMDLERERGIVKQLRLDWDDHVINLIDTPGHVDFGYEVSRRCCLESVILVVDVAQGIEAQTLANCYLAMENDLEIVACSTRSTCPPPGPDRYAAEIENVLGIPADDILRISAKTARVCPNSSTLSSVSPCRPRVIDALLQALIFDSHFDQYRGVISSIRVVNGVMRSRTSFASCSWGQS